jgi:hypothetical protein
LIHPNSSSKKRSIIGIIILSLLIIIALAVGISKFHFRQPSKPFTEDESVLIAREFVKNSPTFKFDGIEKTLQHIETLTARCPSCWQFTFTFDSTHAGYGDRTNEILAQVITSHTARITVQEGQIVSAIMDEKWDMIQQTQLSLKD